MDPGFWKNVRQKCALQQNVAVPLNVPKKSTAHFKNKNLRGRMFILTDARAMAARARRALMAIMISEVPYPSSEQELMNLVIPIKTFIGTPKSVMAPLQLCQMHFLKKKLILLICMPSTNHLCPQNSVTLLMSVIREIKKLLRHSKKVWENTNKMLLPA